MSLHHCLFVDSDVGGSVVEIDFLFVADGSVSCIGEFAATEKGLIKVGNDVDSVCWGSEIEFECRDVGGLGCAACW